MGHSRRPNEKRHCATPFLISALSLSPCIRPPAVNQRGIIHDGMIDPPTARPFLPAWAGGQRDGRGGVGNGDLFDHPGHALNTLRVSVGELAFIVSSNASPERYNSVRRRNIERAKNGNLQIRERLSDAASEE
jgi:hypothetical protein